MTRLEREMHTATVHTTRGWDGASRIAWRSLAVVGGAFSLLLLRRAGLRSGRRDGRGPRPSSAAFRLRSLAERPNRRQRDPPFPHRRAERHSSTSAGGWWRPDGQSGKRSRIIAGRAAREDPAALQYWGTEYDWRKAEAKLNALPQFVTTIDGVDIQFVHVRSRHPNAMPLIMTHGWPGSIFELLKVVGPLTDPTAHGGRAEDAFDLVMPSLPGYGFSGKPEGSPWGPDRMGRRGTC